MSEPQKRTDRDAARGEFSTIVTKKKKNILKKKITSTSEHMFTKYSKWNVHNYGKAYFHAILSD